MAPVAVIFLSAYSGFHLRFLSRGGGANATLGILRGARTIVILHILYRIFHQQGIN